MLIEFSVANFLSFHQEQSLVLVAAKKIKGMTESHTFTPKLINNVKPQTLLNTTAIYGPNDGGKSALIAAIGTMKKIVTDSFIKQDTIKELIVPFKLNSQSINKPSLFEAIFIVDGVRYQYGFTATSARIEEEWLFAFPKGRTQRWFERSINKESNETQFAFGGKLRGHKEMWKKATSDSTLFLSTAKQYNSEQLTPIYNWFCEVINTHIYRVYPTQTIIEELNGKKANKILELLFAIDLPGEDSATVKMESLMLLWAEEEAKQGSKQEVSFVWASDGTRRMLDLAGPLLYALTHGTILIIDNISNSLNTHVTSSLIDLFHDPEQKPKGAQLIFTTHDTSLMNQELFRRDQIWFCQRNLGHESELYPLTIFKDKKREGWEKDYLQGRYGATPT